MSICWSVGEERVTFEIYNEKPKKKVSTRIYEKRT